MSNDKIMIKNLRLRCILGFNDWERRDKQDVIVNITLWANLTHAVHSDSVEDSVNYRTITKQVINLVEDSSHALIESLAGQVIDTIFTNHQAVQQVQVHIDKPGALRFADSVAVELTRGRD